MISFNPGPSALHPDVNTWFGAAVEKNIFSISHRSAGFKSIYKDIISLFQEKFDLPADYLVVFASSATQCWAIISENLIIDHALHISTGDFGHRWYNYVLALGMRASLVEWSVHTVFSPPQLPQAYADFDLLALTQSETANGSALNTHYLEQVRSLYPDCLIAIDATSSLGGIYNDWKLGDVWFASVQKCLGLPAGMAVMFLSPKAVKHCQYLNRRKRFDSLAFIIERAMNYIYPHTPNMPAIWLLYNRLLSEKSLEATSRHLEKRAAILYHFLDRHPLLKPYVSIPENRSLTVACVETASTHPDLLATIQSKANQTGILLGNGYGALSEHTFRIANFPQLSDAQFEQLFHLLNLIND